MPFVYRLSQAGYNWNDGFDKRIISEDCPLWKIALSGTFTMVIPVGSESYTLTIPHNLGYKPEHRVYSQRINNNGIFDATYYKWNWNDYVGVQDYIMARAVADTVNLTLTFTTSSLYTAGYTLHGFYQIFYHPIL